MTLTVEAVTDPARWRQLLACMADHDFTHTYDFHRISEQNGEGLPVAFVVLDAQGSPRAFWPLLRRPIEGTGDFDYTSVYGYAGPLIAADASADEAMQALRDHISGPGAVSLFSRTHPLHIDALPEEERGKRLSDVVVIAVGNDDDVMTAYRGSHRREVTKALKAGLVIETGDSPRDVDQFHALYVPAMKDLGARNFYLFEKSYITSMVEAGDFETIFLTAWFEGTPISSAMFIVTGQTMQYYLSGTDNAYRKLSPAKAIIAEAHRIAVQRGLRHLVLGGGVGSSRDPLFEFKAGFSDVTLPFHVIQWIMDPERYHELRERAGVSRTEAFFPAYRATAS